MTDPRVNKLAEVLVHYSLELKPGQKFMILSTPQAEELVNAVYRQAVKAGAHVQTDIRLPFCRRSS
jgi:aminopeptidase